MANSPSTNGSNGRSSNGRFATGNRGGPGNPYVKRVARVRSLILDSVTDDDLRGVILALIERAKGGDVAAARELLNRLVGPPAGPVDADHLELQEKRLRLQERQVAVSRDRLWFGGSR